MWDSNCLSCFLLFFHIAFHQDPLTKKYNVAFTIKINEDGRLVGVICCSKFPWERERISPKIIRSLGMRPPERFPNPVRGRKCLKNISLKGLQILSLPRVSTCLGRDLCQSNAHRSWEFLAVHCSIMNIVF